MARISKNKKIVFISEDKIPYTIPDNWRWVSLGSINQYSSSSIDPSKQPDEVFELYSVPSSAEDYPEIISGKEIGSTKQEVEK